MTIRFGSVCSGIEAASLAWKPLGWEAAWLSEIERFPCAVLHHHYGCGNPVNKPHLGRRYDRRFKQTGPVPNLGDVTKITEEQLDEHGPIDLLVGGTPCQSFSVAGLRKGLADPHGNLALRFLQLAGTARPTWVLWENVPGIHSSWTDQETFAPSEESCRAIRAAGLDPRDFDEVDQTADFDHFLAALQKLGYGWAYRILDAQYFGVPQRRRRVFVVGYLGDWRRAVAVLFERDSLCGYPPPSRATGDDCAVCVRGGTESGSNEIGNKVATGLTARYRKGADSDATDSMIVHALRAEGFDASEDGTGRGTPIVPVAYQCHGTNVGEMGHLRAGNQGVTGGVPFVVESMAVRRLTPLECERLQGFPDNYTNIPYGHPKYPDQICPDGPRYKALGNSMAVSVMQWIGKRIRSSGAEYCEVPK